MSDRLPSIQIKVATSPSEFLERLQRIASGNNSFHVEFHRDFLRQGYDILELKPLIPASHTGLVGQFIGNPEKKGVAVEIRADRWNPEPPTYEVYVDAAKEIVGPLLAAYNILSPIKCRLVIQPAENLKPKLPPRASERFNEFVVIANKQILHPLDWQRFYHFIYACSAKTIKTTQEDVKELLIQSDFSDEVAENLADIFWHGVSLLRLARR
jgi:hypothetical protein